MWKPVIYLIFKTEFDWLMPPAIFILQFFLKILNLFCKGKKRNGCFPRLPSEIYVEFKGALSGLRQFLAIFGKLL